MIEQFTTADHRRHGIAHMSEFLSIRDLISRVRAKLPEGTPIPTDSTVIHSFVPPNIHSITALDYSLDIGMRRILIFYLKQ